jgi:hypothetical protein
MSVIFFIAASCGELNPKDFASSFIMIRIIRACPACPVECKAYSSGVAPADGTGVFCEICGLRGKK